ncbi:hypothetical protein ILUMI_02037 [Ignelater luminosus]|uniref:DDE-1 domain-containing protein n=1 Tax=Ignelater luminosus TaxID=2038154 RepID=A0A8K0DDG8_IGNLU|nr:hypothetical protein ILUMI_02037 [Ignelater luminosus]
MNKLKRKHTRSPGKPPIFFCKVNCPHGVKYPEKIWNFSKSSTSLMICGSAAGEVLPPYVAYKSSQIWTTWTEAGPTKCRYHHTTLKKLPGRKVIIADNLSTHLNVGIFKCCREENVCFVCLPPNSTHLTQPLDVAFFHPIKVAWRKNASDEDDDLILQDSSDDDFNTFKRKKIEELREEQEELEQEVAAQTFKPIVREVGAYVVFMYESELYPGVILSFGNKGANITAMIKSFKSWK